MFILLTTNLQLIVLSARFNGSARLNFYIVISDVRYSCIINSYNEFGAVTNFLFISEVSGCI